MQIRDLLTCLGLACTYHCISYLTKNMNYPLTNNTLHSCTPILTCIDNLEYIFKSPDRRGGAKMVA